MTEIFKVVLAKNNVEKLRFPHGGGALPGGSSDLRVRDENGNSSARVKEAITSPSVVLSGGGGLALGLMRKKMTTSTPLGLKIELE